MRFFKLLRHFICIFQYIFVPLHPQSILCPKYSQRKIYKINRIMQKNYLMPATKVVQMKTVSHVLGGSQSWPSNAPVNAERRGYEKGNDLGENW
jgi:hypothetical protein